MTYNVENVQTNYCICFRLNCRLVLDHSEVIYSGHLRTWILCYGLKEDIRSCVSVSELCGIFY